MHFPVKEVEKINEIYGWHNIPGYEEEAVLIRRNVFSCASRGMTIKFQGKQCHAAYPETGVTQRSPLQN